MSTAGIGGLPNVEYELDGNDNNPNIDFPACFTGEEKVAVA